MLKVFLSEPETDAEPNAYGYKAAHRHHGHGDEDGDRVALE
jgi:hypothetical protein